MSFADQHLYGLGFFVLLYGALLSFMLFQLYRMIATGQSLVGGEHYRRGERPADYWIDVAYLVVVCVACVLMFAAALGGRPGSSRGSMLLLMAVAAMYAGRALVARFVDGDDRHFRRTWWAARYWSLILLGTAFAAFVLLVPKA